VTIIIPPGGRTPEFVEWMNNLGKPNMDKRPKHSLGDWRYDPQSRLVIAREVDDNRGVVICDAVGDDLVLGEEAVANGLLLAAAPNLLTALKSLAEDDLFNPAHLAAAHAAIAKAEKRGH
jgi:hypothetical protein